jgi:tellurite resistance protein
MPTRGLLLSSTELLRQAQTLRNHAALLVKESQQVREESVAVLAKIEATLNRIEQVLPVPALRLSLESVPRHAPR